MIGKPLKLVCVGDAGVGKTALLLVHCGAPFPEKYFPTVTDIYTPEDSHIELADTAGAEELDRLRPFSYDKADAFIIAFSIDNRASLENVEEKWVHELRYFRPNAPVVLVGCKNDLRNDPTVVSMLARNGLTPIQYDEGEQTAQRIGAFCYVECSAKQLINVKSVFDEAHRAAIGKDAQLVDILPNADRSQTATQDIERRRSSISSDTTALTGISAMGIATQEEDSPSGLLTVEDVEQRGLSSNHQLNKFEEEMLDTSNQEHDDLTPKDDHLVSNVEGSADDNTHNAKPVYGGDTKKRKARRRLSRARAVGRRASLGSLSVASSTIASLHYVERDEMEDHIVSSLQKEEVAELPIKSTTMAVALHRQTSGQERVVSGPPSPISSMKVVPNEPSVSTKAHAVKARSGCQCTIL